LAGIERLRTKFGDGEMTATRALQSAAEALERAMLETQEAREAVSVAAQSFDVEPGRFLDASVAIELPPLKMVKRVKQQRGLWTLPLRLNCRP